MENLYLGDLEEEQAKNGASKIFVLIIYDIVENKKRLKLAKLLEGYGFRVQKSAFESELVQAKFDKLLRELVPFGKDGDSVRVYRIVGKTDVITFGREDRTHIEDVLVL